MVDCASSNLFVAFTPYNVFHACGVALSTCGSAVNDLVVCADFEAAPQLVSALQDWPANPFRHIRLLPGARDSQPLPWRVGTVSLNSIRIRRQAQRQNYQTVYVFNERRSESQAAMYWVKQGSSRARAVVIEDGLNAYRNRPFAFNDHPLACRLRRALYGRWTEDVLACGTTRWVDQVMLMYPHLVNKNVAQQRACELPRASLLSQPMAQLAENVAQQLLDRNVEQTLPQIDGLFLLSHSGVYRREANYRKLVHDIVDGISERGMRIAVKYHPREHLSDPFGIESRACVASLPRGLSSEFLLLHPAAKFRLVLGDMTSALMTARWLKPAINAVCLAPVLEHVEQELYEKMATLGIHLADRDEPISDLLEQVLAATQVGAAA